ncbi:MAG: iron-sulfur cluster assembly protein [Sulfurovum sp.]|nr:iron-sulfur cluster assembly protein [Sulfurovum sp.]
MKDLNNIQYNDIPSTAEEMAAWEAKFGNNTNSGADNRFDVIENKCHKPKDAEIDEEMRESIINQLKTIYDPELPVDIYNLGLIYHVDCWKNPTSRQSECKIIMTLTSATCSMSEVIVDLIRSIPSRLGGDLACIDVELVFDPPWDQNKMSDEAKLAMGML